MVDTATYHLMHPMAKALDKAFPDAVMPAMNGVHSVDHARFDTRPNRINKDEDISPEDIMLLPAIVLGFNFQAKKWSMFTSFSMAMWNSCSSMCTANPNDCNSSPGRC